MAKEDLIVDNPLLLTSLFQKGIYVLSNEKQPLEKVPKIDESTPQVDENPPEKPTEIQTSQETLTQAYSADNTDAAEMNDIALPKIPEKQIHENAPSVPPQSEPRKTPVLHYPNVAVLHIVAELGSSPYKEQIIPNTMSALTKSGAQWGGSFEIIDHDQLGVSIMEYLKQAPKNMKIIFWGKETPHAQGWVRNTSRFMLLSMPSVMLATQESKAQHWAQIKAFFGI